MGTRLGEFEILALLGVGGFGMVYRAFDHSLHRAVAIKEFMPAALAARTDDGSLLARSPADQAAFMAGLKSFIGEGRACSRSSIIPRSSRCFASGRPTTPPHGHALYTGMTFKQARAQMRTRRPGLAAQDAVVRAGRVAGAAQRQTLHRDVSPDNLFLQDIGPLCCLIWARAPCHQ